MVTTGEMAGPLLLRRLCPSALLALSPEGASRLISEAFLLLELSCCCCPAGCCGAAEPMAAALASASSAAAGGV